MNNFRNQTAVPETVEIKLQGIINCIAFNNILWDTGAHPHLVRNATY